MASSPASEHELPRQATLDVRDGWRWPGAQIPVELELGEGSLRILLRGYAERERRERLALQRLVGSEGLGELRAGREVAVEAPLAGEAIAFPRRPGLRSAILVRLPGRADAAVTFLDVGGLAPLARGRLPWSGIARLVRSGPAAKRARAAWRAEVERRARALA